MNKHAWVALAFWMLGLGAASTQTLGDNCPPAASYAPEVMAKAAQQASDRGFLWRLERDGRTSYLYGSLHVGKAEWMSPGPAMLSALRAVDTVALEVDMTSAESQQALSELYKRPSRPIPPALHERLERLWLAECLPLARLNNGPVELQAYGLVALLGRRQGFDPAYASELMLTVWAKRALLPVESLESVTSQLKLLMADTDAKAVETVSLLLDQVEKPQTSVLQEKLIGAWAKSDLEVLEQYLEWCECAVTERGRSDMKKLLDDRNPGLADGIERLHAGGRRVFTAVGALHMTGPLALPGLMVARGFAVTRVH